MLDNISAAVTSSVSLLSLAKMYEPATILDTSNVVNWFSFTYRFLSLMLALKSIDVKPVLLARNVVRAVFADTSMLPNAGLLFRLTDVIAVHADKSIDANAQSFNVNDVIIFVVGNVSVANSGLLVTVRDLSVELLLKSNAVILFVAQMNDSIFAFDISTEVTLAP